MTHNRHSALNESTVLMAQHLKPEAQNVLDAYAVRNRMFHGDALEHIVLEHSQQAADNSLILTNLLQAVTYALARYQHEYDADLIAEANEAIEQSRSGQPLMVSHPLRAITLRPIPTITIPDKLYLEQVDRAL